MVDAFVFDLGMPDGSIRKSVRLWGAGGEMGGGAHHTTNVQRAEEQLLTRARHELAEDGQLRVWHDVDDLDSRMEIVKPESVLACRAVGAR